MASSAAATAAASLIPLVRQAAAAGAKDESVIYLVLAACGGVVYTLGTEKYIRAMLHRHIYVRISMLFLSALCWLGAAVGMGFIAYKIFAQTTEVLEGTDRILGVLIPAVVRADLIVDWAKRVSWALLNLRAWVAASVQLQRLLARTLALRATPLLTVSRDVLFLANAAENARGDSFAAEIDMWQSDVQLVHLAEIVKHFRKLARISLFGTLAFFAAVPAAALYILYALFSALRAGHQKQTFSAIMYALSIPFAPAAAVIVLIASAGLVIGVVSLSVSGTLIQFAVHWSIRVVYSMVRITLSEQWAGWRAFVGKSVKFEDIDFSPDCGVRHPAEAASAMARVGCFFPTELEFVLAPWDGAVSSEDEKLCDIIDFHKEDNANYRRESTIQSVSGNKRDSNNKQKRIPSSRKSSRPKASHPYLPALPPILFKNRSYSPAESSASSTEDADGDPDADRDPSTPDRDDVANIRERNLSYLGRLGLDTTVNTKRRRRLSNYYALGMFVNMQVESGGKAFCLKQIVEYSDSEFDSEIEKMGSFVAKEAAEAAEELARRLKHSSKYRIIHSGAENEELVSVQQWLRNVTLFLLDSPVDSPQAVGMFVRQEKRNFELPASDDKPS